jgi:hypothetical protein
MSPRLFHLQEGAQVTGKLRLFGCGVALFFGLVAHPSYGGNTALVMDSPAGDWVGGGQSWYYTAPNALFVASRNSHNGVTIFVQMDSACWTLDFSAPNMMPLSVGTYAHALRYPFEANPVPYDAGLSVQGGALCSAGHGCSNIRGSFVVRELVWAENGDVVSFHASLIQSCERWNPPLQGEVFYNATAPPPPRHHITSPVIAFATEGQPFKYQISTSKPETVYSAAGLPAGLALNTATGLISGAAEENGQFDILLTASGPDGSAVATLSLSVDLPGRSTGPFTAMRFLSEPGDPIGQGYDTSGAVGDGMFYGVASNGRFDLTFYPWAYFGTPTDFTGLLYLRLGGPIMPGTFFDTNPGLGSPDIYASIGNGPAPYDNVGSYTIKEVSSAPNGRLEHFRGSFVQYTYHSLSPLRGWAWFQAENVITSWPFAFGKEGRPLGYQIIANNQPSSYSSSALPPGLSLDPVSGRIAGNPTVPGSYTVTVSAYGPSTIASEDLSLKINPAQALANISTRARVGVGASSLIGGFIITGRENKKVIIRAIGPSLAASGLTNLLDDPMLELRDRLGNLVAANDDWRTQQAQVEASGLPPPDDHESAIVVSLPPGNYTAIVTGKSGGTGIGLVEVYDLDSNANAQLANISTRGFVNVGDDALIGGFIVGFGGGQSQSRILFRAMGPSLLYSGISNYLSDPVLELHNANGAGIATNDNWRESQQAEIEATALAPSDNAESAILITLPAGMYTAVVRGDDGGTGVALVEAYLLDN